LKDEKILSDMDIFHGVITWNNREIDIAPETVYEYSYPYCDVKSDYGVADEFGVEPIDLLGHVLEYRIEWRN
jgi:hypothetical protein